MKQLKKFLVLLVIVLTYTTTTAQSNNRLFYKHSFQFNIAGLGFERVAWLTNCELLPETHLSFRAEVLSHISPRRRNMVLGYIINIFSAIRDVKFLWLFKSAYWNSFADANIRYMHLDGIYNGAGYLNKACFIGVGMGQTWAWNSGFTICYWLSYGPPIGAKFKWKNTIPEDGYSLAKTFKYSSGLDFSLALGYSFGSNKN